MSAETGVALASVCRILRAPRSTIYARAGRTPSHGSKRGPRTALLDDELLVKIREAITGSPFSGEGHRKVTARLRREHGIRIGRKRVLRLMREAGLLAPQRARGRRKPRPHDGTIIPAEANQLWGTDATMAYTRSDGWVWAFVALDHHTAEAWASVARRGDRFAALEPIYDATRDRFGELAPDICRGISCRHDWGPQYTSSHFTGSLAWLGIEDSPSYVGEPSCNGCAERFIRTLKEQCIWSKTWRDAQELTEGVAAFVELYNHEWLIERHGHRTPREAYEAWVASPEVAFGSRTRLYGALMGSFVEGSGCLAVLGRQRAPTRPLTMIAQTRQTSVQGTGTGSLFVRDDALFAIQPDGTEQLLFQFDHGTAGVSLSLAGFGWRPNP